MKNFCFICKVETLYTIVSRDQKYKVKSFIDTFVYRGGDAIGSLAFSAMSRAMSLSGIAFAVVPVAALWTFFGYYLGKKQKQLGDVSSQPVKERS